MWWKDCVNKIRSFFVLRSRGLTQGEKRLVESIFGQSLDTSSIKIVAHRLILKDYAISPNGHVYFHLDNWCEDFSAKSVAQQSWLIHELTHVWQIQQGIRVLRKALFDRRYAYVFEQGKQFLHYGVEQQAQMVQDYFLRRARGQDCQAYEQCIPFLPHLQA